MATPPIPPTRSPALWRQPWQALELEDLMLGCWLLLVGHLLGPWLTAERAVRADGALSAWTWLALAGLAVVFFTRGPDDDDLDRALLRRLTLVGPLAFLLGPIALLVNTVRTVRARQRAANRGEKPPPEANGWPAPALPLPLRRTLVLPMEILGEGLFRAFIPSEVQLWSRGEGVYDPFFLTLTLACLLVGYAVLVAGPRIVAGAALDWRVWTVRFVFYLGAAAAAGELPLGR
ncbi:MAG: hypothetical protein SF066_11990 [Thermoanaerobaculia bacterium]|nr:hypothetical protein [Thermoanaerobaculia bacterium]